MPSIKAYTPLFGGSGWIRTNVRLRPDLQSGGFSHSPTEPNLVDRRGLEPRLTTCKAVVIPPILAAQIL